MQLVTVGSDSWRAWPNIYMYLLHVLPAFPVQCGFAMVHVLRGRNQTSEYTWLEELCRCAQFSELSAARMVLDLPPSCSSCTAWFSVRQGPLIFTGHLVRHSHIIYKTGEIFSRPNLN